MQTMFEKIQEAKQSHPVDVDRLVRELGLALNYKPMPSGMSGELVRGEDGSYTINVNKTDPRNRQRFTIAHELGHFVYHRDRLGDGVNDNRAYRTDRSAEHYNPNIGPAQETEANRFAASLLMPWELINQLQDQGLKIPEMAEKLGVSVQAMSIRLGVSYEPA